MKSILFSAIVLLSLCARAEEKVTINVFKMKDGRVLEALRVATVGDEGSRTFTLKTTTGERVMVMEADIESRSEKKVAKEELPETATAAAPVKAPAAKPKDEDDGKKSQKLDAVHKDVDARIAFRKIDDEIAQTKAKIVPFQQAVAEATAAMTTAQNNSDTAAKDLAAIPDAKKGPQDAASKDAENKREARRDSLRKRMKAADDEKAKQAQRKADAEKVISDGNDQLKALAEKRDAAQKASVTAAAEKSKAIESELSGDATPKKPADSASDNLPHTLTLKDGTSVHAKSMKKLDGGVLLIVDDKGQERRLQPGDVKKID